MVISGNVIRGKGSSTAGAGADGAGAGAAGAGAGGGGGGGATGTGTGATTAGAGGATTTGAGGGGGASTTGAGACTTGAGSGSGADVGSGATRAGALDGTEGVFTGANAFEVSGAGLGLGCATSAGDGAALVAVEAPPVVGAFAVEDSDDGAELGAELFVGLDSGALVAEVCSGEGRAVVVFASEVLTPGVEAVEGLAPGAVDECCGVSTSWAGASGVATSGTR